jgi:hypothetical protein
MNSKSRIFVLSTISLLLAGIALFLIASGSTSHASSRAAGGNRADKAAVEGNKSAAASSISDKPLSAFQCELLDIAFHAATKLPVMPHLKTRSRMQEEVAATCLELDQPQRALRYVESIADWRRGKVYADYAFYCAQHGDLDQAELYLDRANKVALSWAKEADAQEWHVERIKVAMARTLGEIGQHRGASVMEAGAADFETKRAEALKAKFANPEAFEQELKRVDQLAAAGNFDEIKSALEICGQLHKSFYADADRRTRLEMKIKDSWSRLPVQVRIDLLTGLTNTALDQGDRGKARDLVSEARAIVDGVSWLPEDRIPLIAKLAVLLYRAGDEAGARSAADLARQMFNTERSNIQSANRAGALRSLAEAYGSMGDAVTALKIFDLAVEEGSENSNARPRAEDLTATCRSMALHGIEPDAGLKQRVVQIYEHLGEPW